MSQKYIILGLTPQGLALLRELGRAGADVYAFCASKSNVGYRSRYGVKHVCSSMDELKKCVTAIATESARKPYCFVTSGEILAAVLRDFRELYDLCCVFSGPVDVVDMLAHKDLMYAYAATKGFRIAPHVTLDRWEDGCLRFPVFLKRNYEIPLFFKAVKVNTPAALCDYIKRIPAQHLKDVIAQEFIDIPANRLLNVTCQGFFVKGRCAGTFVANQKRRLNKGLTACLEEVVDNNIIAPIVGQVKDFMGELQYDGFAEFEFMLERETGNSYFLEVNTRPCGTQSAFHKKFINIAEVLLRPDEFCPLQVCGDKIRWMNIVRDVRARVENHDFSALADVLHCRYDIWDCNDLRPFFHQIFKL